MSLFQTLVALNTKFGYLLNLISEARIFDFLDID